MNKSVTAIVLRSEDYNDFDKRLTLFTENGEIMRVIIRGVKRPKAKLRFAAQQFAFCNFELSGKNTSANTVIGAMIIEDLFGISSSYDKFFEGCIMLEASEKACSLQPNPELFIILLKRLQNLLYDDYPYKCCAISYLQNIIHKSGYSYVYNAPKSNPGSVIELLSCTQNFAVKFEASNELIDKTFNKIVSKFEDYFSCDLKSKSALV